MKSMHVALCGTHMTVTGTDSIGLGNPMSLSFCLLCATAVCYILQLKEAPPSMVSMQWNGVVCGAPSSGCQGSNDLDSTEGKESEGLCRVDF